MPKRKAPSNPKDDFLSQLPHYVRRQGLRFNTTGFEDIQQGFAMGDYRVMTGDKARNKAFARGLSACASLKPRQALEIGPGAHLTLTKILCQECPTIQEVVAFECNRAAVKQIKAACANSRVLGSAKLILIPELLSDQRVIKEHDPDLLLHELVGMIASLELAHVTLTRLYQGLDKKARISAPGIFGTFFLPTNFASLRKAAGRGLTRVGVPTDSHDLLVLPSFVAYDSLGIGLRVVDSPFGKLELFDCQEAGADPEITFMQDQTYINTFTATQDCMCDALALFVALGFDSMAADQLQQQVPELFGSRNLVSATASLDMRHTIGNDFVSHSRNWPIPVVCLRDSLSLVHGDVLRVAATAYLTNLRPRYTFSVVHLRAVTVLFEQKISIN